MNVENSQRSHGRLHPNSKLTHLWRNTCVAVASVFALVLPSEAQAQFHNIAAGNFVVVQNDSGDTTNSVTLSMEYSINDLRVRPLSNRGDYNVQIGDDPADDFYQGVIIPSVRQNGRDNFGTGTKTNCVVMMDYNANGSFISVSAAMGFGGGNNPEYNINVAGAWFPFSDWVGGMAQNTANGGPLTQFVGYPGLTLGTHFIDNGNGRSVVDLTSLGIDSRTSGVLLVSGAKNESANFALSQVNTTNGTWNLFIKDAGGTVATNFEQDPIGFVFIPKTNTTVVSGRFLGNGSIDMYSGNSPQFTVTNFATGRYELKIPGHSPTNGVLIISAEGGGVVNIDNMVTYEMNATRDGWEIQSRDIPGTTNSPVPLESPDAAEAVASFVYIPVRGITVSGTNNLTTTEAGGTAMFTVVLDAPPTSTVTINLSSSNTSEGTVSPDFLTFDSSNWNVPQTVTATGQDDAVADGPIGYSVILSSAVSADTNYNGLGAPSVAIINSDNEGGIAVVPTSGLTTTEAGGAATFTVRLNTQPSGSVTIGLSSSDTTEGTVSPSSVTFTTSNWDQEQTVTVTGVDDLLDDGDIAYTIVTAPATSSDSGYNNLNAADVALMNTDNDTVGVSVSPTSLAVVEGTTTSYTVVLNAQPAADVTVSIVSSDTTQGGTVSPASLTFTPADWNSAKTVNVTGSNDTVPDGNTAFNVTNSFSSGDALYAALAPIKVSVMTLDNEAVITLPSGDCFYGIGQSGVGIDGRASISDTNSPNYNGGTLTIALTSNATSDDRLEIRNTGTAAGQIGVSGNNVSYGGVTIGSFSGGTGAGALVVSFNNLATPAAAEALLQSLTFRNVNVNPAISYRDVSVTLVDGDGGTSTATTRVRVSLVRATEFQEGADHGYGIYSGESDIHLRQADAGTAYPSGRGADLFVDYPDANNAFHVLLRFDNIFGTGPGQIPTNAIIVSADLILHFTDSGGGSPLYRMLRSWDATNETWNSMVNGIDHDGTDARSDFDSQVAQSGGGTTGVGTGSISVLPDLIAWINGETNYGWGMTGWTNKTDGTGFSPSESPIVDERPGLRVTWVPAGTSIASFRYGVNGYTNAVDTFIRTSTPDSNYVATITMFSDWTATTNGDNDQLLFRFDNIVGAGVGQIPVGSTIHAAMFDVANVAGQAQGDGGQFFGLLQPWDAATTTWNSWNNGITNDGVEALSFPTVVAGNAALTPPNVQAGFHGFEVTPDVQAWVNGTRANYGWALLPWPNGNDGWGVNSAESPTERDRPQLRIYFTPNTNVPVTIGSIARNPSNVTIQFNGQASTTYSVQRSGALGTTWSPIGSATTDVNGSANFTDNAPLGTAAFYRIAP